MSLPFQKFLCPQCGKMTLVIWPAAGNAAGRKQCTNDRCKFTER